MPPRRAPRGGGSGRRKAGASKYQLAERLPLGQLLQDVGRRQWRLGRSIGTGGFGEIYLASSVSPDAGANGVVPDDAPYVVKVEPHSNGPLFTEMHCYHRLVAGNSVADWMKRRRLTRLGMPAFLGSGSVQLGDNRYRFMVLERYGTDLQRLLDANANRFPLVTVLRLAVQVIDVLEYIHSKEYVHADIKGQNLLLGFKKGLENQVYLVDFGLACRYSSAGVHNEYRADKRKAHNGTIEFTSRDAHVGAHSRRGDLEVLGYNLLLWSTGRLPWMPDLKQCERVAAEKCRYMASPTLLLAHCVCGADRSVDQLNSGERASFDELSCIEQYLCAILQLEFDAAPDYDTLRRYFTDALARLGHANYAKLAQKPLQFSAASSDAAVAKKTAVKKARLPAARAGAPSASKRHKLAADACSSADTAPGVSQVAESGASAGGAGGQPAEKLETAEKKTKRAPRVKPTAAISTKNVKGDDNGGGGVGVNNVKNIEDVAGGVNSSPPPQVVKRRSGLRPRH